MANNLKKRPKIGIVVDYSIRVPNFKDCYSKCKAEIISGTMSQEAEGETVKSMKDFSERDFWVSLHKTGNEAYTFYETCLAPQENYGENFDYTYKKYFYNNEHRLKFLEDWSYNLFGQGSVTNSADIKLINICQSKVADVILIDRTTHARKVSNTMAFLSRSQLFVKGIEFISRVEDLKEMRESKEFIDIYDAVEDNSKVIIPGRTKIGVSSEQFLNWLMSIEKKSK